MYPPRESSLTQLNYSTKLFLFATHAAIEIPFDEDCNDDGVSSAPDDVEDVMMIQINGRETHEEKEEDAPSFAAAVFEREQHADKRVGDVK